MSRYAGVLLSLLVLPACLDSGGVTRGISSDFGQSFIGNAETEDRITELRLTASQRSLLVAALQDRIGATQIALHSMVASRRADLDPAWAGEMDTLHACGWLTIERWDTNALGSPTPPAPAGPVPFEASSLRGDEEFSFFNVDVEDGSLPQNLIDECREHGIRIWGRPG